MINKRLLEISKLQCYKNKYIITIQKILGTSS